MLRSISVLLALIPLACGDNARPRPVELAVVLDNTPEALSNEAHPAVAFHVDGGPATTTCAIDGAAAVDCASPYAFEIADGDHTLTITATADTADEASNHYDWHVDTVAPDTAITAGPPEVSASPSPSIAFSTVDADAAHFECALDGAAFAACTSPVTADAAGGGLHVFAVRAIDAAGNADATPAEVRWTYDSDVPSITIINGPDGATPDPTPTWRFTVTGDPTSVRCRIDADAFADCAQAFTAPGLRPGAHTFDIEARDALGAIVTAHRAINIDPTTCGNGKLDPGNGEVCDGANLGGATCSSAGHPSGTLACAADCGGFDTAGCTGGYTSANLGFTGTPCFDGIRFSTPLLTAPYALVCTEQDGVFKTKLDEPMSWANTTASGLTSGNANPHGRAIAVNPNGPPVYYVTDTTTAMNGFRSNNGGDSWTAQSLSNAGTVFDVFAFIFRQTIGNIAGSWDPTMGAVVLHGNQPTSMVPHFVGDAPGAITGTVRSIANGGPKDVYVAVHGQTPSGAPATGGIFRACDLTQTGGGTYAERDAGLSAADRNRVWSLTVDPSSLSGDSFPCGESTSAGFATTYYAALRGGGQVYKTTDGGVSWTQRNAGLPAGAEVYAIAIDCYNNGQANYCPDHDLLYAATSAGLYKSSDGGDHWTIDGFEGQVVRAVAIQPSPDTFRLLVGVDDATGMYRNP